MILSTIIEYLDKIIRMYSTYINVIGCFLLFVFAIHLLFSKLGNVFLNRMLVVLMAARCSQTLFFILVQTDHVFYLKYLLKIFNVFYYAAPACSYLYFKAFINEESKLKKWEWLHFLPVIFAFVDMANWFTMDVAIQKASLEEIMLNKSIFIYGKVGIVSQQTHLLICTILFLVYLLLSLKILLKNEVIGKNRKKSLTNNWLTFLFLFLLIIQLARLLPFLVKIISRTDRFDNLAYLFYSNISNLVLICVIIFVLYNPKILYGYVFLSKDFEANKGNALQKMDQLDENFSDQEIKVKKVPVTNLIRNEKFYKEQTMQFMQNEKPYLNIDFSIQDLSRILDIPLHQCSYLVNHVIGKSFREWINEYRVDYFIQEYPTQIKLKTIQTIAFESGFKNKNTFYTSFKKKIGVLPSDYFSEL